MRIIAFIHDEEVFPKILKYLNLWDVKRKLPPRLPVRCTQTGARMHRRWIFRLHMMNLRCLSSMIK